MTTPTKRLSIELDGDLLQEIEAQAEHRQIGRNLLIDHLLRHGLGQLVPVDEVLAMRSTSE